jgi:arginyl-tRNA synthetase
MLLQDSLSATTAISLKKLFDIDFDANNILFQKTKKEFSGDITLVVFPFTKASKKNPSETANLIGEFLKNNSDFVSNYNVVQGFLNLEIETKYWLKFL